jgi:hypothetical protein
MQDFDEARHVRAFEIMRQIHVHVEIRNGVLLTTRPIFHLDGVIDVFDTHLVDGDLARIGVSLDILHGVGAWILDGHGDVHIHFLLTAITPDMVPKPHNSRNFRPFDRFWLGTLMVDGDRQVEIAAICRYSPFFSDQIRD